MPGAVVSNMTSAYSGIRWGTGLPRQFQYEQSQSRIGGSLWEYPMRYLENSPIFRADRVQTPLLMINNDEDDAVPWQQGIEFFTAMRRLGKEAYMFVYNGEKHGLRQRDNQKHWTVHLAEYFDYFFKDAPKLGDRVEKGSLPPPQGSPDHLCFGYPGQQALVERAQPGQPPLVVKVPKCSA